MRPKERVIAALVHQEPDRVPTGENQVDGKLVEQILDCHTHYNMGWHELEAIWADERDRVVSDYCDFHVALPRACLLYTSDAADE